MVCANQACLKEFNRSTKFSGNQKFCSTDCMREPKRATRHITHRATIRRLAKEAGLSTKMYMARKYESMGWNYAVEVIRKRCKKRGIVCTITPQLLRDLYAKQNGFCPITGWSMELRKSGSGLCKSTVSVDRIDHHLGYTPNNIRLISFMANNAKYIYTDNELFEFCKSVLVNLGGT